MVLKKVIPNEVISFSFSQGFAAGVVDSSKTTQRFFNFVLEPLRS